MIQMVAEAFSLKRQFGINGLVTQEEMDVQSNPEPINVTPRASNLSSASREERLQALNELNSFATSVGLTGDELRSIGKRITGESSPAKWSALQIDDVHREIASYNQLISQVIDMPVSETASPGTFDLPSDEDLPF
jgi:hypothetical protein